MVYTINPTEAQESILLKLESVQFDWGTSDVYPDGLHDNTEVRKFSNGSIIPFIVVHFSTPYRTYGNRSLGGAKLDALRSTVIVECVANNGTTARLMSNIVSDELTGWKPARASQIVPSDSAWEGARALLDMDNKPSRWVTNVRFDFGISSHAKS